MDTQSDKQNDADSEKRIRLKKRKKKSPTNSTSESESELIEENKKLRLANAELFSRYQELAEKFKQILNSTGKTANDESKSNMDTEGSSEELADESNDVEMPVTEDEEAAEEEATVNAKYSWITKKSKKLVKSKETGKKVSELELKNTKHSNLKQQKASEAIKETKTKTLKPAPIYVREKTSNKLIKQIVSAIGKDNFHATSINKTLPETKIQVYDENHFRLLTAEFDKQNKNYFTYQLKSEKGLSVVIKGIEPEMDVGEIKEALELKGFKIKNVHNIINRFKVPQPLHIVELEPEVNHLKKGECHPIYDVRYMMHRKVTVEEPRRRSGPVQCFNCQEYGHTKSYCRLPTVCVICGDNHSATECKKDRSDPTAKQCNNCGGNHTANFRGCAVYAHIKMKSTPKPQAAKATSETLPPAHIQPGLSFANALSGNTPPEKNQRPTNQADNNAIIPMFTNFMGAMKEMMQEIVKTQTQIMQLLVSKNA